MEVKTGYKLTEAGILPIDWSLDRLGNISSIGSGGTPDRTNKHYWNGNIPWVTTTLIDFGTITSTLEYITEAGLDNSAAKIYDEGTILMAMYGQGKTRGKVAVLGIRAATNQACAAIVLKEVFDKKYILLNLASRYDEIRNLSNTGNQENLNGELIKGIPIPIPPTITEQTAIATALSDADALISSLEKLIAKKRNIKQGVMQQLLQPKEGWEVKRLGDIGKPYGGLSGKSKVDFESGNCPFIPFMNIMSNPVIDPTHLSYVSIKAGESQNSAIKGDLFFNGSSETPEEVGMCSVLMDDIPNLYLNSFCFGFRLKPEEQNNGLFLSYFFRSSMGRKIFYSSAQGATRYNLSKGNFLKLEIHLPKPEEQNRIATVLSDMDKEIFALEVKLEKYKEIKQGMMEQLLTGKIRLV